VFLADDALADHPEHAVEQGLRKALTPYLLFQASCHLNGKIIRIKCAIGFQYFGQIGRRQQAFRHFFKSALEFAKMFLAQAEPGSHCVAAEFLQQMGMTLGHQIQRIAQVQARNAAARTLDLAAIGSCKGDYRAMKPVF